MDGTSTLQAGRIQANFCWQVLPEYRQQLLGPEGLRLNEWLRQDLAQVIKHGPNRTVWRVQVPGLDFHVKYYPLPDLRAWLRQLVRPSKARGEYRNAVTVAERGIATFLPIGLGEQRSWFGPGASFLLTRTLEDTEPLNTFLENTWPRLPACRQTRLAPRLAVALGKLLARMHDAGIWHTDLHAGNVLVRLDGHDEPQLFLIDLHAVSLRHVLDWRTSRANLVMLNRWFSLRAGRSDRLRFWDAYCAARTACPELKAGADLKAMAIDLEERTCESNVRFWWRRDRRCVENNRVYRVLRTAEIRGYTVRDLDPSLLDRLRADPDEPFRRPGVCFLKNSRSSTVRELEIIEDGQPRPLIYKRFRVTSWSDAWLALVRPTGALRSWVAGQGLRERSVPTPRALAVFQRCRRGLIRESYLLTEKITNACDLHGFMEELATLPPPTRRFWLRQAIDHLGRLIRHLHRCRLSHRDLKAANILVSDARSLPHVSESHSAPFSMWLIDLVGVRRYRRLRRSRRLQNLARLHCSFLQTAAVTRTDKLRFLRTYMQWGLLGKEGWKNWWRGIDKATVTKVNRNLRSGRPLK